MGGPPEASWGSLGLRASSSVQWMSWVWRVGSLNLPIRRMAAREKIDAPRAAFSASLRSCLASAQNTKLSSTRTSPRLLVMSVFKNNKTIFSIFSNELPSRSDVDDSLESMSEPGRRQQTGRQGHAFVRRKASMRQYAWEKGEDSQDSQDDDFFDDDEVSSRSVQKRTKRGLIRGR